MIAFQKIRYRCGKIFWFLEVASATPVHNYFKPQSYSMLRLHDKAIFDWGGYHHQQRIFLTFPEEALHSVSGPYAAGY